ncbi:CoA-binding protein [Crocinitomix catalasitica]|uniref:CoA-binding protein n=1 Tax=Crocinitomix catalasitica TaxID=184607 RepID=UPI000486AE95|nr:CoA-binding protein [Crocinitomix catalasitica]
MRVLVIGASEKKDRYANMAINDLLTYKHDVFAIGSRKGNVEGVNIETEHVAFEEIDTVTMYVGPQNQTGFYDYILSLKPRRVIFNPGTENSVFENLLEKSNIETIQACTLVMLRTNQFE